MLENSFNIEGYAAVFNLVDLHQDIFAPGAFQQSLNNMQGELYKLLWQHEHSKPIGLIHKIYETPYGLYMHAHVCKSTNYGQNAYELLRNRIIDGLSVGLKVNKFATCEHSRVRHILQAELLEISVVTYPAQQKAKIFTLENLTGSK